MNGKRIAAFIGIVTIATLLMLLRSGDPGRGSGSGYILDNSHKIPIHAVKNLRKKFDKPARAAVKIDPPEEHLKVEGVAEPPQDTGDFLSGGVVNHETLRFLRFMHEKFRGSMDTMGHLEEVRGYLFSNLPEDQAGEIFRLYGKYLVCEMDLMEARGLWEKPEDPEDYIDLLKKMQEFRRERLGDDVADTLFGAEVKSKEYAIRRAVIVNGKDMYGGEKEAFIETLNTDMWGEEDSAAIEEIPKPYNRYREKIAIYARDFEEMSSDDERSEMTRKFREVFFPAETVERLEEVDRTLASEKAVEDVYFQEESGINDSPDLTLEEKTKSIRKLQEEAFKDTADAFRRREAMNKGLESLKSGEDNT